MPSRRRLKLNQEEEGKLVEHLDHDPQPYVRERCAAILKIARGKSPHWVSQQGLLQKRDPDTVYNWLNIYETEGLAGLIARQHGGYRRGSL
jgi:hypothetical protein